jgi:Domain of unknown function (DUF4157)
MRMFDQKLNQASRARAENTTRAPLQARASVRAYTGRVGAAAPKPRAGHDFSRTRIHVDDLPSTERSQDARPAAPAIVHRVLASPGQPLVSAVDGALAGLVLGLDFDFSQVRVHSDALAAQSAAAVRANAYTAGSHVVFGRGHGPGSHHYPLTLAHELAHVIQQREIGTARSTIPMGSLASVHEREANQFAHRLIRGAIAKPLSSAPLQLSRQPRLTIVDDDSGLTAKELGVIVVQADKALRDTTAHATDKRVKAGVKISYQRGLKDVDKLVKRGDVIVYVIGAAKGKKSIPQDRMEKIARDVVVAQGLVPKDDVDRRSKSLASDLREQVDPKTGAVTGRDEFDPGTSVSIVNVDLHPKRDEGSLRAIAGNVLHEGPGHRALRRGYHNPKDKGVMSKKFLESATREQILFQSSEWQEVNDFLKGIIDDPTWNK